MVNLKFIAEIKKHFPFRCIEACQASRHRLDDDDQTSATLGLSLLVLGTLGLFGFGFRECGKEMDRYEWRAERVHVEGSLENVSVDEDIIGTDGYIARLFECGNGLISSTYRTENNVWFEASKYRIGSPVTCTSLIYREFEVSTGKQTSEPERTSFDFSFK